METAECEPGKSITYKIVTKAVGATSTVVTKLEFKPTDAGGTAIHWTGDLTQITGLLKMVPKGLLQGTASKVIEDVWAAVTKKLEGK
jgi:carbon monoxide dehydrogenase subunit G